jgi:2-methylisocitrate lyase-like PEP mutase family enzyme
MSAKPKLRQLIRSGKFIVAPGVYDMISARVADRMGFDALYMTGYGVTASYLGLPDAGLATYTDMLNRASAIAGGTETPLIADADTGYGGLLNVRHTVRGYEAAGVQAIQLEDQETPKKCGHTPGRRVVPMEDMVQKVKVAVDSRRSEDTLIIARTDARTGHGIDEAIRRAAAYVEAGADIAFVESPESVQEIEKVGRAFKAPKLANMVPGGRTPVVGADRLKEMGFQIAIYPGLGFSVAAEACRRAYTYLQQHGSSEGLDVPTWGGGTAQTMHELMGFPEVWEFEKRWGLA